MSDPPSIKIIKKCLNIYSINLNSLVTITRRAYLSDFLERSKPDIVLLCETKLNSRHTLQFKDYRLIRRDRRDAILGGGTAILINKCFEYEVVNSPTIDNFECLELTCVCVRLPDGNRVYIIAAYASQRLGNFFNNELQQLFEGLKFDDPSNYYIIAGDLNAKHSNWLNAVNNSRGVFLNSWIADSQIDYRCRLLSSSVSTFPSKGSFLDICIADARLVFHGDDTPNNNISTHLNVVPYASDHHALHFEVSYESDTPFLISSSAEKHRLNYGKTNWPRLQKYVDRKCREIVLDSRRNLNNSEIDCGIADLENIILSSINRHVPKIKNVNSTSCYITPQIQALINYKKSTLSRLFKIYRSTSNPHDPRIPILKSILNNTNILLKNNFKNSTNAYWRKKIQSISQKDPESNMFPNLNRIFRKKNKVTIPDLTVRSNDSILTDAAIDVYDVPGRVNSADGTTNSAPLTISTDADKLKIIGTHFERIHCQNHNLGNVYTKNMVRNKLVDFEISYSADSNASVNNFGLENCADALTHQQTQGYFTTLDNLQLIFRKLNNKKSSGLDGVPNIVLKHLPLSAIRIYCILLNNALNNVYFPSVWKKAKVFPIEKKNKDLSKYSSYRPISLLPNIGKVYEILINQNLQSVCEDKNIIPNCQFGFRRFHSTIHAVTKFSSDCCWHLNARKCVGACLIDLEKAFDTVWRDGLIYKLIMNGFPKHLIKLIKNMLSDRCFVVTNGDCITERSFMVAEGLPQGMVNSPILFNIFLSDLL